MRIHTGERPYLCKYKECNQSFKAMGQLKDHMNKHVKVKEFECNKCGSRFTRKSTLKLHHLIHLGIKPHKCPYYDCNKGFTEKSNLTKHIKIHVNYNY